MHYSVIGSDSKCSKCPQISEFEAATTGGTSDEAVAEELLDPNGVHDDFITILAIYNYAKFKRTPVELVSALEVSQTSLGIYGWSTEYVKDWKCFGWESLELSLIHI